MKEALRTRLEVAARAHKVSLNAELVARLERSFARDETVDQIRETTKGEVFDAFGGAGSFRVMRYLAAMIEQIEKLTAASWENDAATNELVIEQLEYFFRKFGPEGSRLKPVLGTFAQAIPSERVEETFKGLRELLKGQGAEKWPRGSKGT
jgi:hypothetical protein